MFEIMYANPWWTLLYLAIIGLAAVFCCTALRGTGPLINVSTHDESNHGHNCSRGPMDVGKVSS